MRQMKVATVFTSLLVVIVGAIALWNNESVTVNRPAVQRAASEPMKSAFESERKTVALFFVASDGNSFHEETREIGGGATTTEDAKRALTELVNGPKGGGLAPTIPRDAKLLNLFIDSSGTAYVDFNQGLRDRLSGGAQGELYTVFSIVNTLASNFVQITRVQILVEGAEISTLAGHVDTRMALLPQYVF
ncbi:MAG TPA: GerMN domain-containing protein [Verrucomicrobiae bacterium]|nr:GerMN domain-containing protein [Verrucomicrobiae bacterium]